MRVKSGTADRQRRIFVPFHAFGLVQHSPSALPRQTCRMYCRATKFSIFARQKRKIMWVIPAFVSALLLGFYDVAKKRALADNAVLPVLLLNTLFFELYIPACHNCFGIGCRVARRHSVRYRRRLFERPCFGCGQGGFGIVVVDIRLHRTETSATDHCRTDKRHATRHDPCGCNAHIRRTTERLAMDGCRFRHLFTVSVESFEPQRGCRFRP